MVHCQGKGGSNSSRSRSSATKSKGASCTDSKQATCLDKQTLSKCEGNSLLKIPCRGPVGCEVSNKKVFCDNDIGQEGDNCVGRGVLSCTKNEKAMLECKQGKFVKSMDCLGKKKCDQDDHKIFCDSSIAKEGSDCADIKESACSTSGKEILECSRGKWKTAGSCPQGCTVEHKLKHQFVIKCAGMKK
jgi:hypothetical protein